MSTQPQHGQALVLERSRTPPRAVLSPRLQPPAQLNPQTCAPSPTPPPQALLTPSSMVMLRVAPPLAAVSQELTLAAARHSAAQQAQCNWSAATMHLRQGPLWCAAPSPAAKACSPSAACC